MKNLHFAFLGVLATLFLAAFLFSSSVHAQAATATLDCNNINVEGLTTTDITNIRNACQALNPSSNLPKITPAEANEWAEIAKGVAEAIGIAAQELGVAVNDFLKSDAGFLVAVLIVWQVAGDTLFTVFVGFPVLLLLWIAYGVFVTRAYTKRWEAVEYGVEGKRKTKLKRIFGKPDSESLVMVVMVGGLILSLFTGLFLF